MDFDFTTDTIIPSVGSTINISATGAFSVPTGTTAQEPAAVNGMLRYDTTTNKLRAVQSSVWVDAISASSALGDPGANGIVVRTALNVTTARTLTAPAAGITVTNGDGVAGNPTLVLANDLAALEGLVATGIAVRSAADTWVQRTITGTASRLSVTNGDGVAGNPTLNIDAAYVGQASITTLGTITTGTWTGTDIAFANIAQGTARSVLGVTGNATADVASIQGTANQVLVVNSAGTALTFSQVNLASSAAVTGVLPIANGGSGSATPILSRGGTVLTPTAINVIVWRAPYACTVTNVRGYRVGGTGATINARLNGASNHLAAALSLTSADTWMDGGAVQNTAYVAGDKLEIMVVTVAGSPTQVAIQVDFTRS